MEISEQIIIGSGPAGLSAAIYSARANLKPILFAGVAYGGLLMQTTEVENYPGFPKGVVGPELMQNMIDQAKRFGTDIHYKNVTSVDLSSKIKKVFVDDEEYQTKSIIIATGSSPRMLGLESESKFLGKGVSVCATCDAAFYKDKVVAVIGGGDSAMEEAQFLTKFASKVYLIHRKNEFRASHIMVDRIRSNNKIEIILNTKMVEVLGDNMVQSIKLENTQTDGISELKVDGVFIAIGHVPNVSFLGNSVELDKKGYIKTMEGTKTDTSVAGVFVAGDVYDFKYQQAITAAGMGCMASLDSQAYLASIDG